MMPRAPETEALDEGTVPLDSTALPRSLLGHIAREVEWRKPLMPQDQNPWIKKQSNTNKLIPATINNYRGTSGSPPARVGKFGATCSC